MTHHCLSLFVLCFTPLLANEHDGGLPGDSTLPWINLVIHGGSFALIVYIVVILYPQTAKEGRAEREQRDARFNESLKMLQTEFESRNEKLIMATERQTDKIVQGFKDGLQSAMVEMKSSVLTATAAMLKQHGGS